MTRPTLPLLIDGAALQQHLQDDGLVIVDLSRRDGYLQQHIPGARHLDIARIMASQAPVMGLLPDIHYLEDILGNLGITPDSHVVIYDEEANAKACRLFWTLDALGHERHSLLDGGLPAWKAEKRPLETQPVEATATTYRARPNRQCVADREYILSRVGDADTRILDVRSAAEFEGVDKRARRGGHIPGAVNIEWLNFIDRQRQMRLRDQEALRELPHQADILPEHEVIIHCQTHQRSAHTYFVLKYLGYPRVRGYAGAWSDWGNQTETPIANER